MSEQKSKRYYEEGIEIIRKYKLKPTMVYCGDVYLENIDYIKNYWKGWVFLTKSAERMNYQAIFALYELSLHKIITYPLLLSSVFWNVFNNETMAWRAIILYWNKKEDFNFLRIHIINYFRCVSFLEAEIKTNNQLSKDYDHYKYIYGSFYTIRWIYDQFNYFEKRKVRREIFEWIQREFED